MPFGRGKSAAADAQAKPNVEVTAREFAGILFRSGSYSRLPEESQRVAGIVSTEFKEFLYQKFSYRNSAVCDCQEVADFFSVARDGTPNSDKKGALTKLAKHFAKYLGSVPAPDAASAAVHALLKLIFVPADVQAKIDRGQNFSIDLFGINKLSKRLEDNEPKLRKLLNGLQVTEVNRQFCASMHTLLTAFHNRCLICAREDQKEDRTLDLAAKHKCTKEAQVGVHTKKPPITAIYRGRAHRMRVNADDTVCLAVLAVDEIEAELRRDPEFVIELSPERVPIAEIDMGYISIAAAMLPFVDQIDLKLREFLATPQAAAGAAESPPPLERVALPAARDAEDDDDDDNDDDDDVVTFRDRDAAPNPLSASAASVATVADRPSGGDEHVVANADPQPDGDDEFGSFVGAWNSPDGDFPEDLWQSAAKAASNASLHSQLASSAAVLEATKVSGGKEGSRATKAAVVPAVPVAAASEPGDDGRYGRFEDEVLSGDRRKGGGLVEIDLGPARGADEHQTTLQEQPNFYAYSDVLGKEVPKTTAARRLAIINYYSDKLMWLFNKAKVARGEGEDGVLRTNKKVQQLELELRYLASELPAIVTQANPFPKGTRPFWYGWFFIPRSWQQRWEDKRRAAIAYRDVVVSADESNNLDGLTKRSWRERFLDIFPPERAYLPAGRPSKLATRVEMPKVDESVAAPAGRAAVSSPAAAITPDAT